MNWNMIATIAEVVSAVAVVLSLIYLALQIQQSNIESKASTLHQYLTTQTIANNVVGENGEIADLVVRANENFAELSASERVQLQFVFYNHFNQWLFAFESQKRLLIEDEMWAGVIRGYSLLAASSPAFREMWKICRSVYQEGFRDHVDKALEENEFEQIS